MMSPTLINQMTIQANKSDSNIINHDINSAVLVSLVRLRKLRFTKAIEIILNL